MIDLAALMRGDMAPAYGVTEPGAIAFACAQARRLAGGPVETIRLQVNSGIYKNAFTCAIPGTGREGCQWAAALGALGGDPEKGLAALEGIGPAHVQQAQALIDGGRVAVEVASVSPEILICAEVHTAGHWGRATIQGTHTGLTRLEQDGAVVFAAPPAASSADPCAAIKAYTLAQLCRYARTAPLADLEFLQDAFAMNEALLQEGRAQHQTPLTDGLVAGAAPDELGAMTQLACGAIEARVRGAAAPAMSLTGSGSHGILATMPLVAAARWRGAGREALLRSTALSCLVTIYIKEYSGRLSALCGCALAGGTGTACGLVLLWGGTDEQIALCVQNMAAGLTGMICHGGNQGCALKARAAVQAAYDSARLAMTGQAVDSRHSILGTTPEQTMQNIGRIASPGMTGTEQTILDILADK